MNASQTHWRKQMKSTATLCKTIKQRKAARKELWTYRLLSLALILLFASFISFNAIPGLVGTGIIIAIVIADSNIRRKF